MTEAWAIVIAAAIPVLGTGIGFLIREFRSFRRENRQDHANVMHEMRRIKFGIEKINDRLNRHMDWHAERQDD